MLRSEVKNPAQLRGEFRNCLHCGNEFYATRVQIKNGIGKYCSRSCNGYESGRRTHGHNGKVRSKTYNSWAGMIQRTQNPKSKMFSYYGGRGISVDERWLQFENFLADMGEKPEGTEIERRDNDGDYEPSNCYWATRKQQMRNTSWNRMLTVGDRTQCISAWAEETGIPRSTIMYRLGQCLDNFAVLIPLAK